MLKLFRKFLAWTNLKKRPTDLAGIDLSNKQMEKAYLAWAKLEGANLTKTNLIDADLQHADLKKAYIEAEEDPDRKKVIKEWSTFDSEGWE